MLCYRWPREGLSEWSQFAQNLPTKTKRNGYHIYTTGSASAYPRFTGNRERTLGTSLLICYPMCTLINSPVRKQPMIMRSNHRDKSL